MIYVDIILLPPFSSMPVLYMQIFALISIMMVVVSVTGMILASTPEWQITTYNTNATVTKIDVRFHSTLEFVELVCHDWNF